MKDYYEILQVSPNAEPEVIKAAYTAWRASTTPTPMQAGMPPSA